MNLFKKKKSPKLVKFHKEYHANPEDVKTQNYACGCFWFIKSEK
ncbi:hypothetical protein [Epilithonimonas bovis]|nr:hypothetical protein [Epilithonimonas bovis]